MFTRTDETPDYVVDTFGSYRLPVGSKNWIDAVKNASEGLNDGLHKFILSGILMQANCRWFPHDNYPDVLPITEYRDLTRQSKTAELDIQLQPDRVRRSCAFSSTRVGSLLALA